MEDRYRNFTLLISSIYRNIGKLKDMEMAGIGLKGMHLTCLFYLYTYGAPKTAAQLQKLSGEDKAAISRALDYLEREGYVISDDSGYRKHISFTQKGEQTAKFIAGKVNEFVDTISGDMTEPRREVLYDALQSINDNLKKVTERRVWQ